VTLPVTFHFILSSHSVGGGGETTSNEREITQFGKKIKIYPKKKPKIDARRQMSRLEGKSKKGEVDGEEWERD